MEPIVPFLSSAAVGPLGACHLPRMWLKILLHATGRLPAGYRHGTGGFDERTAVILGFDRDEFIKFVETKLPTYLECEAWVRGHAKNLDAESIRKLNDGIHRQKPPGMAAIQRAFAGLDDASVLDATLLNDLDDWQTVHALATTGKLPPLIASSLNAELTELLRVLLDETKAGRTTIRLDLPSFGFALSKPAAEAKRSGVAGLLEQSAPGIENAPPVEYLRRERKILVQDDVKAASPDSATPAELIDSYGLRAQILGPILRDGKLIGIISVHDVTAPRRWTEAEQKALQRAVNRTEEILSEVLIETAVAR
jgi:GAF domain-containing protein